MPNNEVTGAFPVELRELESIQMLNLTANSLVGAFPDELCSRAISGEMHIDGDAANCPNGFDGSLGQYVSGCCQDILTNVDIYLSYFASFVLEAAVCNNLASSEAAVCNYISNKANHAIFDNRYPEDFPGVWD